jgi:signal transduction histidine kinase
MAKETRTRIYIGGITVAAALVAAATAWLWPVHWGVSSTLTMALVAGLVCLAARFPFKLSPQAEASLFTVPLFMGALLLLPAQAIIAGAAGVLVSEWMKRRPAKVALFNLGISVLVIGLSGAVFHAWQPGGISVSPAAAATVLAVGMAGLALHAANLILVAGMVTIRKGFAFWSSQWAQTWTMDVVQEGGTLVLGYVGAIMAAHALWMVFLVVAPVTLAYLAFRRSVAETRRNIELAERNANLAKELEGRVNELQEAQTQLIMQSEKLASVGATAASVVHEVKNAMCVTGGRAELLLRGANLYFKSDRATDHVKSIHDMTQRVTTIVQELLAYSRNDTTFQPTQVSKAMDVAADLIGKQATSKGVAIIRDYAETPLVRGVSNQLQQVFVNLMMNAIDAMPSGGAITLKCAAENGYVVASVKDTGTGIPASVLPRLFEPFVTTKAEGKGTGLGMFVCRKIVTDHKGEISVNSQEGAGAEIVIRLPIMEAAQQPLPAPQEPERTVKVAVIDAVPAIQARAIEAARVPALTR